MRRQYGTRKYIPPPYDPQDEAPALPTNSMQAALELLVQSFFTFVQCSYRLEHDDFLLNQLGPLAPPVGSRVLLRRIEPHALRILALLPPSTPGEVKYYYTARVIETGPPGHTLIAGAVSNGPPSFQLLEQLVLSAGFTEEDVTKALQWVTTQTAARRA